MTSQAGSTGLGRAHQITHRRIALGITSCLLGRNPAVGPHWSLNLCEKVRQRGVVRGVARHHLISQRKTSGVTTKAITTCRQSGACLDCGRTDPELRVFKIDGRMALNSVANTAQEREELTACAVLVEAPIQRGAGDPSHRQRSRTCAGSTTTPASAAWAIRLADLEYRHRVTEAAGKPVPRTGPARRSQRQAIGPPLARGVQGQLHRCTRTPAPAPRPRETAPSTVTPPPPLRSSGNSAPAIVDLAVQHLALHARRSHAPPRSSSRSLPSPFLAAHEHAPTFEAAKSTSPCGTTAILG